MSLSRAKRSINALIQTAAVSQVDIVAGFLSFNNADNIRLPVVKAFEGLSQNFPLYSAVIVCSDASSEDSTEKAFFSASSGDISKIFISSPPGPAAKIQALYNLMHLAKDLKAKGLLIFEAALTSIKRTWFPRLAQPVLSGQFDMTSPFYHSRQFDSPVTYLFGYPFFRALFGRRLRQPFNSDRAISGGLNDFFLSFDWWPQEGPFLATETLMNMLAVSEGVRICQPFMGGPRLNEAQRPPMDPDMCLIFRDLCKAILDLTARYPQRWLSITRSKPTPITGADLQPPVISPRVIAPIEDFLVRVASLLKKSEQCWSLLFGGREDWLLDILTQAQIRFDALNADLWARTIYLAALKWPDLEEIDREKLLDVLSAAFLTRIMSWLREGRELTLPQMENLTEAQARAFESRKKDLVEGWKLYDRTAANDG